MNTKRPFFSNHLWLLILLSFPHFTLAASKIDIEGVKGDAKNNILAHLSIANEICDAPAWRIRAQFAQADEEINQALQAFGYYNAKIRKHLEINDDCWHARFNVKPGQRVKLRVVELKFEGEAKTDPKFDELLKKQSIRPGDSLRHDRYEDLKRAIENFAAERGYIDGRFIKHELRVNPSEGAADIYLYYDSGIRFKFGNTEIEQNVVETSIVHGLITYKEGELYDNKEITETYRALTSSRYFGLVQVRPQFDRAKDGKIPITITLTPSKPHKYSIGLGFATDTGGPRLRLGYEDKRINQQGYRFKSKLSISKVKSEVTAGFEMPLDDPSSEFLSFDGGFKREDTKTSSSDTLKLGISLTHNRPFGWLEKRFLESFIEDFSVGGEENTSTVVTPGLNWAKVVADNPLFTREGYRLFLETRGSLAGLLSDLSLIQFSLSGKKIFKLPWRTRLITRADLGATILENEFSVVPPSLRFFAGGDNSVRGYAFKSLGPTNSEGEVVGGRNLLVGSLEIDHLITEKWGIAAFIDSGNAFDGTLTRDFEFKEIDIKTGTGVGLRWHSPIGPIRLDLALALDKPGTPFRIHISMGPDL